MENKKREKEKKIRFEFAPEFQEAILKYTLLDTNGYQALSLYEDYYFDLIEHQTIASCLKTFYKRKSKIPSKVILKEELRKFFKRKDVSKAYTEEDKTLIYGVADKLFKGYVTDGEEILESVVKFARFVNLREEVEGVDIHDFGQHEAFVSKIQRAISIGNEFKEDQGILLIQDIRKRQMERKIRDNIFPLPYWQMNKYTNAGGYNSGAVFVFLDKAKGYKTGVLTNVTKKLMSMKRRIFVVDLENGEESLSIRLEQGIANKTKKEVLSGQFNREIQKALRKYARLGVEVVIKRLPAGSTAQHIQKWIDYYHDRHGITFTDLVVDYVGLMGAISGGEDDNSRISNAYIDVKNLAERNKLKQVWTGHHVKREAYKRRGSKYLPEDTAKSIEIHRHVEAMYGIQQDEQEKESKVLRLEVIDQRDGPPEGAMYFFINEETQRITEFTHKMVEEHLAVLRSGETTPEPPQLHRRKPSDDL